MKPTWAAFGKLKHTLKNSDIPMNLKREVYGKRILPVTTYGLDTTTLIRQSADHLRMTQKTMERAMLGTSLRDRVRITQEIRRKPELKA